MRICLALSAAIALALLCAGPAVAPSSGGESATAAATGEWSAAKKRRYVRYYRRPAYAYRAPVYGRIGDPSLAPNGRPYPRPYDPGGCIIDEGYGRFSTCSDR